MFTRICFLLSSTSCALGGIDDPTEHLDQVFDIAGGSGVVMTNDHLDEAEGQIWKTGGNVDTRFKSSLRLDSLLNNWEEPKRALSRQGVVVTSDLQEGSVTAIRMQIADALCGSYEQLLQNGRAVTREEIARDVRRMFEGNFNEWLGAV